MTLGDYLVGNNIHQCDFAQTIGVDKSTVGRWVDGTSVPRKEVMVRIKAVTNGAVMADDFMAEDATSTPPRADDDASPMPKVEADPAPVTARRVG